MSLIKGKSILITGGSRGIGLAVARAFLKAGARAAICARHGTGLRRAEVQLKEISKDVLAIRADVSRKNDVARMVRRVLRSFKRIDVLVNNAALLGERSHIARYPLRAWENVLRTNVTGLFLVTQAVLKAMLKARSGCVINVTSSVGRAGRAEWGAYAISKFALEGFTQVLAQEVGASGIGVYALNPGATRTDMRAAAYPEEDPMTLKPPEDAAWAFVKLAKREDLLLSGRSLDARDLI